MPASTRSRCRYRFCRRLKQKAGLAVDHWSPDFRASRFETIEIKWAPPGSAAAPDVLQRVIGLAARYTAAGAGTA